MSEERARLRSLLGASTALWAGDSGVRIEAGRWVALSGARGVDYNVALCHAADATGAAADIGATIAEIEQAGVPALIMLAGGALAGAQQLVEAGWVCVGAVPFMARELAPDPAELARADPRRLVPSELGDAQALVQRAFDVTSELAAVALPPDSIGTAGRAVWGAHGEEGELVSCLAAVRVQDALVVWSMATAPAARRSGHATRLLEAVLADAAHDGARIALLHSSPEGEPFYHARGYAELEHWQLWSRPRWVLGRS